MQGSVRRGSTRLWWRKAALILALGLLGACTRKPRTIIHTSRGAVTVTVEIVDTPDSRARGLMYRRDLGPDAGMLFLFPTEAPQSFWMKNTPLPLDMIFIGSSRRVVGIVVNTRPFSTEPRSVGVPSQYVLEVNAGFSAMHGIAPGDLVEFAGPGLEAVQSADRNEDPVRYSRSATARGEG